MQYQLTDIILSDDRTGNYFLKQRVKAPIPKIIKLIIYFLFMIKNNRILNQINFSDFEKKEIIS
ncbi:MAG: hypothetical protein B6D45_10865 [Ignavibacteriales bacterium UTCHB3]|nr:MAG: hypothetical protein B6D45_10865 [Ignavibacteriales bacterium UTCHB3]